MKIVIMQIKQACQNLETITPEKVYKVFGADSHTSFLFSKFGDSVEFIYYLPLDERKKLTRIDDELIQFLYWLANETSALDLDIMGFANKFYFSSVVEFVKSLSDNEVEQLFTFYLRRQCRQTCKSAS